MAPSRSSMAPGELVDLAPDVIDFGGNGGRGTSDDVWFPQDGDLAGVLPDFLSCPTKTMVTSRAVDGGAPSPDGAATAASPFDLDDFDFN